MAKAKLTKAELLEAFTQAELKKAVKVSLDKQLERFVHDEIEGYLNESKEVSEIVRSAVDTQLKKALPSMVKNFLEEVSINSGY